MKTKRVKNKLALHKVTVTNFEMRLIKGGEDANMTATICASCKETCVIILCGPETENCA